MPASNIFQAVLNGDVDQVADLIRRNANVNETDKHGETPLFSAVESGNLELVQMLVEAGCDIWHKNAYEISVIHTCTASNIEIVEYLYSVGAEFDYLGNQGITPLHYCVINASNYNIVNFLCSNGANIDATYKKKTALETIKHLEAIRSPSFKHVNPKTYQRICSILS